MQEIGCQVVLSCLELLLRDVNSLLDADVESVLLALEHVSIEEVHNLGAVLPRPCPQRPRAINRVLAHVVVEQGVEVEV